MEAAVPYAADEQMRVEALRAAASVCGGEDVGTVLDVAAIFLAWLLGEEASLNAALEGVD